jgi:putative transcriptional regulator
MAEKQFKENRKITVKEVAEATGISRATLSKMLNTKGHSTTTDCLDALCKYFGCNLEDVAVYVEE